MILALGMALDALIGEPRWLWSRLPHPAVLMGRAVAALDKQFNQGEFRKAKGVFALAVLVLAAIGTGLGLRAIPGPYAEIVVLGILLAQRSLATHVGEVGQALNRSVAEGRLAVARIVGRDTKAMDRAAVSRAAIESAAENLSDGVIAPAFWFAIGGLPGLVAYKAVNTADSMVGYRTPRHAAFGWAAARLDDVLNWVPARLTAALILAGAGMRPDLRALRRDAGLHRSPNAGWPEAAMAQALGVSLSGPRSYQGRMQDFPFVNPKGNRDIGAAEITRAVSLLWRAWAVCVVVVVVAAMVIG